MSYGEERWVVGQLLFRPMWSDHALKRPHVSIWMGLYCRNNHQTNECEKDDYKKMNTMKRNLAKFLRVTSTYVSELKVRLRNNYKETDE